MNKPILEMYRDTQNPPQSKWTDDDMMEFANFVGAYVWLPIEKMWTDATLCDYEDRVYYTTKQLLQLFIQHKITTP